MNARSIRFIMLAIAGTLLATTTAMAAITTTSDDFDNSLNTYSNWVDVGTSAADKKFDSTSAKDWYDGNDSTYITNYLAGTNMVVTGDGLLNDGGLRLDVANTTLGDEAIGLTIGGTMELGRVITFTGNLYNDNNSYTDVNIQMWNLTDGTLLAESGPTRVKNYNNISYTPVDFTLVYNVTAADVGDTLQIRFRDAVTAIARDIYVDHFSVSSRPGTYLVWDFNELAAGTVVTNNLAKYDYTSDQEYVGSNAVANTLAFHGRSSGTDYIIRNKGAGYENALYLKTLDTSGSDFGVYLQKLDFTVNGQNSSNGITRVSWSFDILGYDSNGNLDPTGWTVKIRPDNNSQNLNVSDAWYRVTNGAVVAQTFSFVDDSTGETAADGTWTTVSGSYDIPTGSAGALGGIQISTDNGGYTSSGGIFLDNIEVSVENIAGISKTWDFEGDSGTLTNDLATYDYTSNTNYISTNAVANTLAFNGKSASTDYIIRDKGGVHSNALYVKTVNTASTDFGVYLQKLDFTLGGENSENRILVSWSFDILAYEDPSWPFDPTGWTVKVNTDNTSQNLDVTDTWFSSAVLAQTFGFNDDSTSETSTDGTWTTVTGSYEIPAGAAGSVGGIQISTDGGGYTGSGGIFLDNIQLEVTSIAPDGIERLWNFNDVAAGTVVTNNLAKYDYTSDKEYVGSEAVDNTLAFNGRSTGTDYIIRNKGTGYENTLYLKTVNTSATDFGIYLQKLDFTLGGRNSTNLTRVNWSFDILGYDSNGNLDPTGWTVKVNPDNNSQNLNVTDAWYGSAVTAQTFSFVDDSSGETALDGTWTTVTGSYNIAVGTAGSAGGIQISTTNGAYTSGGGIFLDNIQLTITSVPAPAGYTTWADGFGLTEGPGGDDDEDGQKNLAEYMLGGIPTDSGDLGTEPVLDGLDYVTWLLNDDAITVNVMTNADLIFGSWGILQSITIGDDAQLEEYTTTIPSTESALFIELEFVQ